ncbi:MAG: glycosyltransferase family 2 protein [Acidobacteria bacterium]|nr:glycosyltransferase family 2 protein [Acidobacteriota bacterium]
MLSSEDKKLGIEVSVGRNIFSWAPRVSVVIPAYNVAEFIGETLESVAAQRFRDHEVIVVNDGSPDTAAFERAIQPHRENIIYIKQPSQGAGAARNTAIRHARGEIIAFLDGDDIWLPDFLTSQVTFLGRGHDMVYCDAQQFGMRSALRRTFMESAPSEGEVTVASLLDFRCNVITSGTVALRSAIIDAGMFEQERTRAHDFHLWVRMARNGARIGYQRTVLLKYRVHLNSLSGDSVSRVAREIDVFNRIKRMVDLDAKDMELLERRVKGLQADLEVERGKALLISEDFAGARRAFAEANRHRRSLKLLLITIGLRVAPRLVLDRYRSNRADEIAMVPGGAVGRPFAGRGQ